jgi:hypothetical protein
MGRPANSSTVPPVQDTSPDLSALGALSEANPDNDVEIERVLTADKQDVIAPPASVNKGTKCSGCQKGIATLYGRCENCFDKLKPVEKRKLLLLARVTGPNTHAYPADALKTWRTELQLIAAGLWKHPLKFIATKKSLGDMATD